MNNALRRGEMKMAIQTIYAIHAPDADRLAVVIEEMRSLGAPTIKAVNCGDYYMALEGSHRLAAAKALGLAPIIEVLEQDDMIDITEFDWFEAANWAETTYPAGEVAGEMFSVRSPSYSL